MIVERQILLAFTHARRLPIRTYIFRRHFRIDTIALISRIISSTIYTACHDIPHIRIHVTIIMLYLRHD
jgi:hypothetical protein